MELQIDAKELLKQALAEAEPGEDIEEAVLRVCKKRYPEQYAEVFGDILRVFDMMADNTGESIEEILHDLVSSDNEMSITLHSDEVVETRTFSGDPDKVMKELPSDIRSKFKGIFSSDPKVTKIEKTVVRRTTSGGKQLVDCRCGYLGPPEDGHCPKCGRKV